MKWRSCFFTALFKPQSCVVDLESGSPIAQIGIWEALVSRGTVSGHRFGMLLAAEQGWEVPVWEGTVSINRLGITKGPWPLASHGVLFSFRLAYLWHIVRDMPPRWCEQLSGFGLNSIVIHGNHKGHENSYVRRALCR